MMPASDTYSPRPRPALASAAVLSLTQAGATLGVEPLTPAATAITIGVAALGVAVAAAGRAALSLSGRL